MGWFVHATRNVHPPENSNKAARTRPLVYRSETHPPNAYPLLIAARITPINAPHTNKELPKTGASNRLPKISNAMTTAPVTSAVLSKNQRGIRGG